MSDLSPARIAAAAGVVDPVFLGTPQFVSERLSAALGREVLVKVETLNPIGSFKGRGASLLAQSLDPARTWVCATGGNFGQGVAYAARARGAAAHVFVVPDALPAKLESMRSVGARVEVSERADEAARAFVAAAPGERVLIVDGLQREIAEGAGTIGIELAGAGAIGAAVVQLGDGALITGVACALKAAAPATRVVGVCASGAPAMAESFRVGRPVRVEGAGTIAPTLAILEPVPESLARVLELVDDVVLVDDEDMLAAAQLIAECLGLLVEPAGAAGVAALLRHGAGLPDGRVAVLLTGAA